MTEMKGRLVVQQCLKASLKIPGPEGKEPELLDIDRGMVVFVCFLNKATEETVEKLTKHIINIRLCEEDTGKRVSIIDVQGDILIIPQATLGGRLKGKGMQYHQNVDKTLGEALYHRLCQGVRTSIEAVSGGKIKCGVYGARQVLSTNTNGPYTHIIEV